MKLGALLAVGVSLFSLNVFAADGDYAKFLSAMEGNWQGQGSAYNRSTGQSTSFAFEMYQGRQGSQTSWMAQISKNATMGGSVRDTVSFNVNGGFLSISHDSVFGMASVRFATESSIEYSITSSSWGRFLEYTYRWDVHGNGLTGSLEVTQDGWRIYEERWSASKRD